MMFYSGWAFYACVVRFDKKWIFEKVKGLRNSTGKCVTKHCAYIRQQCEDGHKRILSIWKLFNFDDLTRDLFYI